MHNITACVCLDLCLYVYDFVMTRCMKIVIVFPVIASSCFRITQTKATWPPSLAPISDSNIGPLWAIDTALIH